MMGVLYTLPLVLGWVGCYCLARELAARKQIDSDWRLSLAMAAVAWGAIVTVITELGSLGRVLTQSLIWVAWLAVDLGLFLAVASLARKRGVLIREEVRQWWRAARGANFSEWPWDARCYLGATVALIVFPILIALMFATTNWDSLTYHLPRIMHWVQQQSVDHFPTNNERQIEFGPWSAFASMMLYLLWGNDRLINLVQCCAMAGSVIMVSFMVKALASAGGDTSVAQRHRRTSFACLVAVTLPMGLVQCINPQTDYTTTFWLCCLICFALALCRDPLNRWYMLGAGLACGLGTLTKATMYLYAAPLIIGFSMWWLARAAPVQEKVRLAGIFCAMFFLLNAGHATRNFSTFGSPLGSEYILSIEKNDRITASGAAANLVRNLSLYSNTGIAPLTSLLNEIFARAHSWTGRSFNDADITYHNPGVFWLAYKFQLFDSYAGLPYHLALICLAVTLAVFRPKQYRAALWHTAWVAGSFALLCIYLKWQFWHTRLHLAYFVALSPVVAWVLVERLPRWSVGVFAVGLVSIGTYCVVGNESRPLSNRVFTALPRESQHLAVHNPRLIVPTRELADTIIASGCGNVGLKLEFDEAEYAIWVALRNRGFKGTLHHFYVENESGRLPARYAAPDMIIASGGSPPADIAALYPTKQHFGRLVLMSPEGAAPIRYTAESASRDRSPGP